jgi:hypothetical protein
MTNDFLCVPFVSFVPSCNMERSLAMRRSEVSVEPRPTQSRYDPDLDNPSRRLSQTSIESIEDHQRLLVNPFLVVLGWVIVVALIRMALRIHSLHLFVTGIILLLVPALLFQYHCLDCGKTGWLFRYRRHACPAVTARAQTGVVRRFRGLSVTIQIIVWGQILAVAWVFFTTLFALRR